MRNSTGRYGVFLVVGVMLVLAASVSPNAQRRRAAVPNPTTPVATDTITANPTQFVGQQVTLSAGVAQVLSKTVFTVDQRRVAEDGKTIKTLGKPILVIAPTMNGELDKKNYMLFVGELLKFDPAEITKRAKDYTLDLPPDVIAKYAGSPVLLASAVIDSHYVDQAKRPMTAEEKALSSVMRRIGPAFNAMRRALDGTAAPNIVTENAATLKVAFTDSEVFWTQRADAMQWARDARQQAESIERDAAAGNWDAVKATAGNLGKACQTCHAEYREMLDDGSYRIKAAK